jgi:phage FluMu gp28-like protein
MISNEQLLQISDKLIGGLYPYQKQLLSNTHREIIVNKSRQIGISYIIACWALLQSIFNEKNELIISPSLRQSKHMMEYIYQHLNKLRNDFKIELREETKTSLIFTQGGQIHSLPNSANTIRGFQADDVYIDEFAHFTNGTDKEIIEALAPSLSRGGNIRYISTPFGDQNIFYKYWHNRPEQNRILINYRECPDMTKDNLDKLRDILGSDDAWNQEMENMFLSDMEGQEFPTTLIQSCINPDLHYTELLNDREYIAGADIGREHDLTAVIILEKIDNVYKTVYKKTMKQTPYNEQLNFFNHLLGNYHFGNFVMDESGIGNMLAEELSRRHKIERVTFNNENKQQIVGNLKKLMQDRRLEFVDDPQLVNSIRAIRRIYTPSNYLRFDSCRDGEIGHADLFWALALAVKENLSGFYFRLG